MSTEISLVNAALASWKINIDRADKFFDALSDEQLHLEIAPGKNRLIYLWGHLIAVHDALLPLLGVGERHYPELDTPFLSNPDRTSPDAFSAEDLKGMWSKTNEALWTAFSKLSPEEWLQKHTAVSDEDFAREPHRNRYTILLSRMGHVAYHLGQAKLVNLKK